MVQSRRTTALVIGAGIGGISTAARLAQAGFEVTVVEKNDAPGGRCGQLSIDGHRFDTGATIFLMPSVYMRAFDDLGERMQDHLELRRIDPTYHIHFWDGSSLALSSDLRRMQAELEAFEPGSFSRYLRYLNEAERHYTLSMRHLVNKGFDHAKDYFSPQNLILFVRLKSLTRHYRHLGHFFMDERLKIAFSFQNLYMGLDPYRAPAIFSLLQYAELADGLWLPVGGMYHIVQAMVRIAEKKGVRFIYRSPVERIEIDGSKATGVTTAAGQRLHADVIVANADLPYVYQHLLPHDRTTRQLARKKYGCSTLMFYWGLSKPFPRLGAHNLFISADHRQGFRTIFGDHSCPADPSFYVHAPTRADAALSPTGEDTLTAVVPVGHHLESNPQDWEAIQEQARKTVVARLSRFGDFAFEEHIKFERRFAPLDWRGRFNLIKGSTHGLSHNLLQMGYLRPQNRHRRYRNLYFVGASTHPGTGIPTVLISGRLAAERILREANMGHRGARTGIKGCIGAQRRELGDSYDH